MSTPLQRLVDRARGAQQPTALRIEPLLGTPFAMPAGASHELPEVQSDSEANPPTRGSTPSPASRRAPSRQSAASLGRAAASHHRFDPLDPAPRAAAGARRATACHERRPPTAAANTASSHETRHTDATPPAVHDALPAYAPRMLPGRTPSSPATPPTPPAAKLQHAPLAPIEATPSITIAIGRIEVRNAPIPAASPRLPFKPGLSLDAFLRRGKGDG